MQSVYAVRFPSLNNLLFLYGILYAFAARVGQLTDNALFLEPPLPVACGTLSA